MTKEQILEAIADNNPPKHAPNSEEYTINPYKLAEFLASITKEITE